MQENIQQNEMSIEDLFYQGAQSLFIKIINLKSKSANFKYTYGQYLQPQTNPTIKKVFDMPYFNKILSE